MRTEGTSEERNPKAGERPPGPQGTGGFVFLTIRFEDAGGIGRRMGKS